jgi:hypothetical protein
MTDEDGHHCLSSSDVISLSRRAGLFHSSKFLIFLSTSHAFSLIDGPVTKFVRRRALSFLVSFCLRLGFWYVLDAPPKMPAAMAMAAAEPYRHLIGVLFPHGLGAQYSAPANWALP